jgi:lipopolysaccharide transport system permease protein
LYVFESLPESARNILKNNPLQPLMLAYQGIFLDHRMPDFLSLVPLTLATVVLLMLGSRFFLSRVGELVDEL